MRVSMMRVREMGVGMGDRFMRVRMTVFSARHHGEIMYMLMVLVVDVLMLMNQCLVGVLVLMAFRQMQPDTERHQQAGNQQGNRDGIAHRNRQQRTDEWSHRKIRTSTRCAEVTQPHDKQGQADAVGKESNQH